MDPRFLAHNTHLAHPGKFAKLDPHLSYIKTLKYAYLWPLIDQLPKREPGIYTLEGGRQIGKTTLLKQWMAKLLKEGVPPQTIVFLSGELIEDFQSLLHLLRFQLESMPQDKLLYIIIDEVSYIRDWDKAIKFAADAGMLRKTILMLTGSDSTFIKEARMRFPGRRGKAELADFHLYPLSFREYIILCGAVKIKQRYSEKEREVLFDHFLLYLIHGGYLTAINDLAMRGRILESTLVTYSDWIRGDMLKRHKQERYLKEILEGVIKRYTAQVTWNTFAADLSIDHPKTVMEYLTLLESMDAIYIQSALIEHKLTEAPKKAKKVTFRDPFIYHALKSWVRPKQDAYQNQILVDINNPKICSQLVEGCVVNHYARHYPTYYLKGEGEVDVAYVDGGRFYPVEVKWAEQLAQSDLKQILKYPNGLILTKQKVSGFVQNTPILPIFQALLEMT
jgi:uncharacterized protein